MFFKDLEIGDWFTATYPYDNKANFIKVGTCGYNNICLKTSGNFQQGKDYHFDSWTQVNFVSYLSLDAKNIGLLRYSGDRREIVCAYLKIPLDKEIYDYDLYVCIWDKHLEMMGIAYTDGSDLEYCNNDGFIHLIDLWFPEEGNVKPPQIFTGYLIEDTINLSTAC